MNQRATTKPSEPWMYMMSDEQRRLLNALDYNPETGEFRWKSNGRGRSRRAGDVAGSAHSRGYVRVKVDGKTYLAHRLAFLFMTGRFPESEADHVNGIRTDNRWSNLRAANASENRCNSAGQPRRRMSRFKGVVREHRSRRWKAQITKDGTTKVVGHFDTEEEAAIAYRDAARTVHREFAKW
ncbi:HNH endonuclease [Luteibacter sp.]|uniref:HNH endonuclease n=1 Tax=Luteibacter sp. TaxID=1886636 RepID=UPI0025B96A0F|nr:HNH endonuclease [Luteibacter sp.]